MRANPRANSLAFQLISTSLAQLDMTQRSGTLVVYRMLVSLYACLKYEIAAERLPVCADAGHIEQVVMSF